MSSDGKRPFPRCIISYWKWRFSIAHVSLPRGYHNLGGYIDFFGVSASESLGFLLNLHFFLFPKAKDLRRDFNSTLIPNGPRTLRRVCQQAIVGPLRCGYRHPHRWRICEAVGFRGFSTTIGYTFKFWRKYKEPFLVQECFATRHHPKKNLGIIFSAQRVAKKNMDPNLSVFVPRC